MTYAIKLVNMPFSALQIPAISLTQLRSVIENRFGGACSTTIHYLNHDFGSLFGFESYVRVAESMEGHVSGFGEWLFRQAAFPDAPDNETEYFRRYATHFDAAWIDFYRTKIAPIRGRLSDILDDLIDRHELDKAQLVGLTSMFFQNVPSFALARRLKARNPQQLIVLGGANCEGTMGIELINHVPQIDFVFSGHALTSFPQFVDMAMKGDMAACHALPGVYSRDNSQSIVAGVPKNEEVEWGKLRPARLLKGIADTAPELSLDESVALDYDGFLDSYDRFADTQKQAELLFETSRGCWWGQRAHCTFCGLNGGTMSYRAMACDRAVGVIEDLVKRYYPRVKRYASVDNIMPKEYVDGVFGKLRVPSDITMFYEVKADVSEEQLAVLADARVVELQPGIEAIATSTLKIMRKGTTAFNNLRFLINCLNLGIKPVWNLLIGFPGETAETYEEYARLIPLLMHLPPPSGVFPVRFDRFSPYFTGEREYGLDLVPLDYYGLTYPFPERALRNMAYYFRDQTIDAPYQQDVAKWVGPLRAAVKKWHARWAAGDGLLAPRVEAVETPDGSIALEDTRSGHLIEYLLEDREIELLEFLEHPQGETQVAARFADVYDLVVAKRLLFRERGRVISIIPAPKGLRRQRLAAS